MTQTWQGDLAGAAAQFAVLAAEAGAAHDRFFEAYGLASLGGVLAWRGETGAARAAADAAVESASEVGGLAAGIAYNTLGTVALAAGDAVTAQEASEKAWQHWSLVPAMAALWRAFNTQAALAGGDLVAARRWADDAVTMATGYYLMAALTTGTVNLSSLRAIFAGSPPRFTRSRVTYEAYAVSRTSTRPQVDSALHGHAIRFMTRAELQLSHVDQLCELIRHVRHVVEAIVGAPGVIVNDNNAVCCW